MEELFKIANRYYKNQESFSAYGGFRNISLWCTIIFGALFAYFSFEYVIYSTVTKSKFSLPFFIMLLSEVMFLIAFTFLQRSKNKYFIKFTKNETNEIYEKMDDAKIANLKKYFDCEQTEFADVAVKINSMLQTYIKLSKHRSKIEILFNLIYSEDSKPRMLALFILICSIVTILSTASGQNSNYLLDNLLKSNSNELFTLYIFLLISLVLILLGLSYIFKITQKIIIFIGLFFLKDDRANIETLKYLISDLNYYHIFKKNESEKLIIV